MPTYGDKKIKDMAESILPSTARKAARDNKAAINRNHRRTVRQHLVDLDDEKFDFTADPDRELREVVYERRNADKVSPLIRWAKSRTKNIKDPVESYMLIKKMMPDNLIGRHAMTHVDGVEGIEKPGTDPYYFGRYRNPRSNAPEQPDWEALLYKVVEGNLGALNHSIKRVHNSLGHNHPSRYRYGTAGTYEVCTHKPRVLLGQHDIVDFLDDLHKARNIHPEWMQAMKKFLLPS